MQLETSSAMIKRAEPAYGRRISRVPATRIRLLLERLRDSSAPGLRFLEEGKWVTRSGAELATDVGRARQHLAQLGVTPGERVGILGENSYAWIVYDLALLFSGAVSVALPETSPQEWPHAVARLGIRRIVSTMQDVENVSDLEIIRPWLGGPLLHGKSPEAPSIPDEFTLTFSSGTSGRLKCLRVSLSGLEHAVDALLAMYPAGKTDRLLLFLPLSHMQQRVLLYGCLFHGIPVILSSPSLMLRALRDAGPTILLAPPLFYEHIHGMFLVAPKLQRMLAEAACVALGLAPPGLRRGVLAKIFRPIYGALGGAPRLLITGMAPVRRTTLEFFRRAGLPLYEAYGLTECGLVSGNSPAADRIGSVGKAFSSGAVRLDDDGEIVVTSPAPLALGYVDEPEEAQIFPGGGQVRTGDVGRFDTDGFLYIVGRKKEVIVMPSGEKLHPETLEAVLNDEPSVERAAVTLTDDGDALMAVARLRALHDSDTSGLERAIARANAMAPKNVAITSFALLNHPFTVENGLLTRNLKVDRRAVRALASTRPQHHILADVQRVETREP